MGTPIFKGVCLNDTDDEAHSLTGHEPEDVNSCSNGLSTPVTSEDVSRQIKAATDPLTKQ